MQRSGRSQHNVRVLVEGWILTGRKSTDWAARQEREDRRGEPSGSDTRHRDADGRAPERFPGPAAPGSAPVTGQVQQFCGPLLAPCTSLTLWNGAALRSRAFRSRAGDGHELIAPAVTEQRDDLGVLCTAGIVGIRCHYLPLLLIDSILYHLQRSNRAKQP
jgi:hypothetical protein